MKIRSKTNDEFRELPQCSECKRVVFTLWDKEGRCITCSRNKTLGEKLPPPSHLLRVVESAAE